MVPAELRSLTDLTFCREGLTSDMNPCCGFSLIPAGFLRRATTVELNPCQPEIFRYDQIAISEINSVAKKIVTSSNISLSPHKAVLFYGRTL